MSSPPPNPPPPAQAQGAYPPPAGPPPATGAPQAGQYPPPAGAPPPGSYPPPGQAPYGYGGYPAYPGYYPPPGQPGGFGYPPQGYPGWYPPPTGPPPPGAPGAAPGAPGAAPGAPGQPPAGAPAQPPAGQPGAPPAGYPPYGAYPPPPGAYPPPPGAPPGHVAAYAAPPSAWGIPGVPQPTLTDPLFYLGTGIPNPSAPPAPIDTQKVPGYEPAPHADQIYNTIKAGPGKEKIVTSILLSLDVYQMDALSDHFAGRYGYQLAEWVGKIPDARLAMVWKGLVLGPAGYDADLARTAMKGMGTDEQLLTELFLGRPSPEIRLLKVAFGHRYKKQLSDEVKKEVSGSLARLYEMALNAQRPADNQYVDPAAVQADVATLKKAADKKDESGFVEVLVNRSTPHLQAVITSYGTSYKSLSKVIKKAFSGDVERAFLHIVHGVKAKRDGRGEWRDAKLLEKSMAGLGTRDNQLVYRLIRASWDRQRFDRIKSAYERRYNKPLLARVKGETSGPYRDALIMLIEGVPNTSTVPKAAT